jgi:predicted RNA binding protein YcfA (HicA-like mRNA interferase family)
MSNLLSSQEIIRILQQNGFAFVIIPDPKKEIPKGTFASILRQSGLDKDDFR